MNGRKSLHPRGLEFTLSETLYTSGPKILIFEVKDKYLKDTMEETLNKTKTVMLIKPLEDEVNRVF